MRLGVSVRSDTFSGADDQVWISRRAWVSFLGALRRLERERSATASLTSMSPKEFAMDLEVVDRAGHVAVHGYLCRQRHSAHPRGTWTHSRIEYFAEVDAGLLVNLLRSFEGLAGAV